MGSYGRGRWAEVIDNGVGRMDGDDGDDGVS